MKRSSSVWHIVSMNLISAGSALRKYCFMFEYLISSNKKFQYFFLTKLFLLYTSYSNSYSFMANTSLSGEKITD